MIIREERPVDFGAVYFRRSAPPRADWERDYARAAEDGMTLFRHWFSWGAIEIEPGVYNWEPYDRQLELAAKYDIDTIIAEMSDHVPEWFYAKHSEARRENVQGQKRFNEMNASCVAGGSHTMCMDNEAVSEGVAGFLTALGEHYKDMPGLYGYDIWNECSLYSPENVCYCPGTQARFRKWLKKKYGDLKTLNQAWFRFSYTDWSQVVLPRTKGPYPEFFDAIAFQNDSQDEWMRFRVAALRKADPNHLMTAHGNAKAHSDIATNCGDDWRYSKDVEIFGYTFWYGNNCNTILGGDMTRSASYGKAFWRAEAVGDSDWQKRTDKTVPMLDKEVMAVPENIKLDAMMSFVTGATGFMNPRYRPLLDGHLFHAFGWYGPDGSRTDRSETVSEIAKWCNAPAQRGLWKARPVKGEIALLIIEDSQALCYALHGDTDIYASCLKGAYQAFQDSNIQSDVIKIDQIDRYDLVYIPYPVAVSDDVSEKIRLWVEKGGTLISEGCFGYFNDKGHAIEWQQPNRGFAEVFGCEQVKAHLGPDMNKELMVFSDRGDIRGGVFKQSYKPTSASSLGTYADGGIAVVENTYGKGKARIAGTMPGYGYFKNPDEKTRRWFASLLSCADKKPMVKTDSNTGLVGRIWQDGAAVYLWVLNMTEHNQNAEIWIDTDRFKFSKAKVLRGGPLLSVENGKILVTISNRDAAVIQFD